MADDAPKKDPSPDGGDAADGADEGAESAEEENHDSTSRLHELGHYIRGQRKKAELSLRNLAKLAGVSNPYLSQIERGLRKPSAEILQAIAKALEISSETLYVKAGILEERSPEDDVAAAIARDPHLTESQRQALIEMYRSFRRLAELQESDQGAGDEPGKKKGPLQGLIDAVSTGDVDDAAIAAAGNPHEDEDEL